MRIFYRFQVWLHNQRQLSPASALFFAQLVLEIYSCAPPRGKTFRDLLRLHPRTVEKHMVENLRRFFSFDQFSMIGLLYALHWFADFLLDTSLINATDRDEQQQQWQTLYDKAVDGALLNRALAVFPEFPNYM